MLSISFVLFSIFPICAGLTNGIGNGVNLQPSYYNSGNVNLGLTLMKQNAKIKTVRLEVEPNMPISLVKSWISQIRGAGFQLIVTYHKATVLGSNDANEVLSAANWWKANYAALAQSGSFTVNLINEWGDHSLSAAAYANAVNAALKIVRTVYAGKVVLDAPGWGQEAQVLANAITGSGTGGVKISDANVIPSLHIYPGAWNQVKGRFLQNSDIDDLAAAGRSLIIGEFGSLPAGSANWSGLVQYAKGKGYTILGWAWNGDGAYGMNMASPSWSQQATATSFTKNSAYFNTIYNLL